MVLSGKEMTHLETLAETHANKECDITNEPYEWTTTKMAFLAGAQARQQEIDELVAALTKIKDVLDEYGISPTDMMLLAEATNVLKKHGSAKDE